MPYRTPMGATYDSGDFPALYEAALERADIAHFKARAEQSPLAELTRREHDVMREMAEGKNNAAIAQALSLTERSVEKVIHSIFLKLGITWEPTVHKRVRAVLLYLAASDP